MSCGTTEMIIIIVQPLLVWVITPPPTDICITTFFQSYSVFLRWWIKTPARWFICIILPWIFPYPLFLPSNSFLMDDHHVSIKMCSQDNVYFWILWFLLKALKSFLNPDRMILSAGTFQGKIRALLVSQAASLSLCILCQVSSLRFRSPGHQFSLFLSWTAHPISSINFPPAHSTRFMYKLLANIFSCFW